MLADNFQDPVSAGQFTVAKRLFTPCLLPGLFIFTRHDNIQSTVVG